MKASTLPSPYVVHKVWKKKLVKLLQWNVYLAASQNNIQLYENIM